VVVLGVVFAVKTIFEGDVLSENTLSGLLRGNNEELKFTIKD